MARLHYTGILGCLLIMGLIIALGPYHTPGMLEPDRGPRWYYWQLAEPDFWTRFSAWSLYALHQLGIWGLIAWAQFKRPNYINGLHPVNLAALALNLAFVIETYLA